VDPYALIPLVSCVLCTGYCLSVRSGPVSLDDRLRDKYTRGLMGLFAVFCGLQVGYRVGGSPAVVGFCLHASALVLIAIGPVAVATCFRMSLRPHARARGWAMLIYTLGAVLIAAELSTRSTFVGIEHRAFGVRALLGPLFLPVVAYALTSGVVAFITLSGAISDSPDFDKRGPRFGRVMRVAIVALLIVTPITDVILPLLDRDAPQLASLGFGLVSLTSLWTLSQRDGGHLTATPALISEHILHALNEGVAFLDVNGQILLANESAGHLLGDDPVRLVGRVLADHLPDFSIDSAPDRLDVECELEDLAGQTQPVSLSLTTVRDERGMPLGRVVVLRDVRELKTLKSRLVLSGRLAAVGQMAAGIAHEINNPISFVRTNLGVLREHWEALDGALQGSARDAEIEEVLKDGEELIAESVEGVDRAAGIVRDVRELSHAGPAGRIHMNVNQIVERVIRVMSSDMSAGITIERRFGPDCRAYVSPDQMTQVFVNLLTNAIHAVDQQGHIVIESRCHSDMVEVSVIDDGRGVSEAIRDRIFDPFYTTKEVGVGTGLGLSISHEIVRGHGGELIYSPTPTGGACFTVHLAASTPSDEERTRG